MTADLHWPCWPISLRYVLDDSESRINALLEALGIVQGAFRTKVEERGRNPDASEAGWDLRVSDTKPPDTPSWSERRELLRPDGVPPCVFRWGYVDAVLRERGGAAWLLDLPRHRDDDWAIDRMITLEVPGRVLSAAVCEDSQELAQLLPCLVKELLAPPLTRG